MIIEIAIMVGLFVGAFALTLLILKLFDRRF